MLLTYDRILAAHEYREITESCGWRVGRAAWGCSNHNQNAHPQPTERRPPRRGRRWQPAGTGAVWMPVVVKDWSNLAHAQANWRNYGASAYKQKDLNYF